VEKILNLSGFNKLINQEIYVYYLANVDHNIMALHLTRSDLKGFKKCCISTALDETDRLWNGSEEDGNVRSECQEDADTNCEDGDSDTVW